MGDSLIENYHYELCDDTSSSPHYQNYDILYHGIELQVDPLLYAKKTIKESSKKYDRFYPCWLHGLQEL